MNHIQLLAPAGGMEQLRAAVRCGADAVYLGGGSFNARQNAENFGGETLAQAVSYCHGRGVKVHVTLNTLVTDRETDALLAQAREIAASGADAVIVQDLGVAALVRAACPQLPLHGSTQLSIHNAAGAQALKDLGFSCVVLARELSALEIGIIRRQVDIELETFVHGALCMSFSGQCYLSAMLGERSGNRGLCAQPCRLDFHSPQGREYALSLKDLSLVERMGELKATGVAYLKIEGRMKRPEYVAAATAACRGALDGQPYDTEALRAVFSRSGFTDGYFTARRDLSMFGTRRKEDVTAAAGVLDRLAATYRGEAPLVPVDMTLQAAPDQPSLLEVRDGEHTVTVRGEIPQLAINRPTDEVLARRGLEKTGGTPFFLRQLTCQLAPGLMLPVSAINALRKSALEELLALREQTAPLPFVLGRGLRLPKAEPPAQPELRVRVERADQLSPELIAAAARVILPVEELESHRELFATLGDKLVAELPLFTFPQGEEALRRTLAELAQEGLRTALVGGLGAIALAKGAGLAVWGDYSLNVLNSQAVNRCRELGVEDLTLSIESNLRQAAALGGGLPLGVIAYGLLPLMTFRNCPAKGPKGCGSCQGRAALTDRLGNPFPILCHRREYSQLLNMVPLYLGDRQEVLRGFAHATLRFTTEDAPQCRRVLQLWQEGGEFREPRTGGLYFRDLK